MQWVRECEPDIERQRVYVRALLITLGGNLLLLTVKAAASYFSGSVALYADAVNSFSDMIYALLMVLGIWMAQRPPDLSHPQGHSRFEPLVGLVIALAMAGAGTSAARAAWMRYRIGGLAVEPGLPTAVLLFSAAVKAGMYAFLRRMALHLDSPALMATARDDLSDVLTSTAAVLGALGSAYLHPLLDPIAAFVVSAAIFYAAFETAADNLRYLTGGGADAATRARIAETAQSVPGVRRVHQVITEYVGPRLAVDLHINVDGDLTLREAHRIANCVQQRLLEMAEVDRVYVHVEPDDGPARRAA